MTASATSRNRPSTRTILLLVVALVAGALFLLAGRLDAAPWLRLVAKPIPVLCLALWVSWLPRRGRYQLAIAVGLMLSALGDILLEVGDATFIFGLAAFLLGHVAYIVAFVQDTRKLHPLIGAAAYAYGLFAMFFLMNTGDLAGMLAPVQLYMLVIATMLWRAACRVPTPTVARFSAWAGLIGALFFVVSDSILAFRLFGTPIQLGGLAVMATYWLGQLGIALSARDANPKPQRPEPSATGK